MVFLCLLFSSSLQAFTLLVNAPGWQTKELTIYVNPTNCNVDPMPAVKDAISLWNTVSTASLKLKAVSSTSYTLAGLKAFSYPGIAGIACDTSFDTTSSTLGLGTYAYGSGESYGYVRLNASGGTGDISKFTTIQQAAVLAHEMGHLLNIGHTNAPEALMYYALGDKSDLSLSWDDVQAYSYLYPRDELGQDGFMGCARLTSPRPGGGPGWMLLLAFPLLVGWLLKRYEAFKTNTF